MKKYKKILLKLEKSGTGSLEWDFLSDMKELNMSNHVINLLLLILTPLRLSRRTLSSRSILINLLLSANTLFIAGKLRKRILRIVLMKREQQLWSLE